MCFFFIKFLCISGLRTLNVWRSFKTLQDIGLYIKQTQVYFCWHAIGQWTCLWIAHLQWTDWCVSIQMGVASIYSLSGCNHFLRKRQHFSVEAADSNVIPHTHGCLCKAAPFVKMAFSYPTPPPPLELKIQVSLWMQLCPMINGQVHGRLQKDIVFLHLRALGTCKECPYRLCVDDEICCVWTMHTGHTVDHVQSTSTEVCFRI